MWKREQVQDPAAPARPEAGPGPERRATAKGSGERATIGRSITIRGEVTGDEDLLIQGRVDGSVNLKQHSVTVGPEGEVKADIIARVVTIEGNVEGNLSAEEQVILRSSARVQGDITAPRVMLDDGAYFRGGVDMGEALERGRTAGAARPAATRVPETGRPPSGAVETSTRMGTSASTAEGQSGSTEKGPGASQTAAQVTR